MVIDRHARHKLGLRPGWVAIQTVVGDHLEVRFLPPVHDRSLAGSLKAYARKPVVREDEAKRRAWEREVESRWAER
jgi:hypothetical protein